MHFGKKEQTENSKNMTKWLQHTVAIFFIFVLLSIVLYLSFNTLYRNKIYPGMSVAGIKLSGLTLGEAKDILNKTIDPINDKGIKFEYQNKEAIITPVVSSFGGDMAFSVIVFHVNETVDSIYSMGRSGSLAKDILFKFSSLFYKRNFNMSFSTEDEQIIKILEENYKDIEGQAKNADLTATTTWNIYRQKKIVFDIIPEQIGFTLDYKKAIDEMKDNLLQLDLSSIKIESNDDVPDIIADKAINVKERAEEIIKRSPISLSYEDNNWIIEPEELASWLGLKNGVNDLIVIDFKEDIVEKYLEENISSNINKEPVDAKFEVKEGRVVEFQTSENGIKLNPIKTLSRIRTNFLTGTSTEIAVATDIVESNIKTENVNDLGIKEIIGTGHSNFAGSPNNRIHNIKNGSGSLNGLIIKPDEEFSLITALGEIDADNGYLPELVIKGNRTIPEYGGGLCQVGTTLFRTVVRSGLPVTARRNHSYRVSYYEPAGTDATIYDPWPDFKFINDTGNNILIQTRFDGNDMYFDFWGTKDGREITITDPTIYNIVPPGATKMIETTDLAPGEKKCTESAHAGADAYFDYTVVYPDGETKEERFSSHYIPWQAVCLVGVEEKPEETTASSSEEIPQE